MLEKGEWSLYQRDASTRGEQTGNARLWLRCVSTWGRRGITAHVINKLTNRLVINQDPAVITWTMLFFCNGLEIKNAPRQQEQWFRRISSLYRSIVKIYTIIKNGKVEIKKWTSWLCFCFLFSQCSCCTLVLPFTVCQCFHCSIVAAAHSIGLGFDGGLFNHHSGSWSTWRFAVCYTRYMSNMRHPLKLQNQWQESFSKVWRGSR